MYKALLYKKDSELYRRLVQKYPPLSYYGANLALLVAGGGLIAQAWPLALAGTGLWALHTLAFALSRLRGTSRRPAHVAEMALTSALIPALSV